MLRDTRQEIMKTAKQLFNERGYNNVSTQDIASSLGISKGNLTYHFKKKEEIIEALLAESTNTRPENPPTTLQELNSYFEDIQNTVKQNAFYFWHHAQLAQMSPKIHDLQKATFRENTEALSESFRLFECDGLIRSEEYLGEYNRIIDALFLSSVYWIPFCELKGTSTHEGFLEQAWSILYPLLTETGKRLYRAL